MAKARKISKYLMALILSVVLFVGSPVVAYAVDPVSVAGAVISGLSLAIDLYVKAQNEAERQEALDSMMLCWDDDPPYNFNLDNRVKISAEELNSLCMELNRLGFPCKVKFDQYVQGYVIVGQGYVYIPGVLESRQIHIGNMVACNYNQDVYYADWKSDTDIFESILQKLSNLEYAFTREGGAIQLWMELFDLQFEALKTRLDMVNVNLEILIETIKDLSINVDGGTFNFDTLPITNKLDEVIEAIEGISITTGDVNFDTLPIVSKLDEVIEAIEGISITADGVSFDTLPIVTELKNILAQLSPSGPAASGVWRPSTLLDYISENYYRIQRITNELSSIDFATDARLDQLLAEIQKISTHADLKEVVTVKPGVLGDVEVATASDWRYEDLTFYYEPAERFVPDGSPEWTLNTDYIWVQDDGSASVDHISWDYNTWGGTDVSISLTDDFYAHIEDIPEFYLEFVDHGGNTVFTVSMQDLLSGTLYYSVYYPAEIFCIRVVFPSDAYVLQSGTGFDLLTLKYGSYGAPMTDQLSFTADGVPHTLYWWNEYEFTSDGTLWSGIFLRYTDGHWYFEDSSSGTVWPVLYYDAYLTEALTSAPTTVTTVEGETYTWFEWFYTSYGKGGSGGGSDLTPVVMRLDTIIENLNATVGVAGCNHTYRDELDQEPTCILPGLMNHICSQCGSCYSEIVPSLGHNWEYVGYDPEVCDSEGQIIQEFCHIFKCSRCGEFFYDYINNAGDPTTAPDAPAKESDSLSSIIARLFEKLGNFAGELLSGIIKLLDKLLTGFDDVVTGFNEKAEQIATVGGDYPQWLSGVWGIIPADLQLVLTFCVIAMCVAVIGKKIFFVS